MLLVQVVHAQYVQPEMAYGQTRDERGRLRSGAFDNDSVTTKDVPEGIYMWKIDERFGQILPSLPDTSMHRFPQSVFTSGPTMRYNSLGNLGSPRISRIFTERGDNMLQDPFIFLQPYDYFVINPGDILFTNTKSPFTNLTYLPCGSRTTGEERLKAQFAVNAGKKLGFGFQVDYLYGRGYYQNQNTGQLTGTLYGSYIDEHYNLHLSYGLHLLKTSENGGLESDEYITNPERLATSYDTRDMPVRLTDTYNYIDAHKIHLAHRYNLGNYIIVKRDTLKVTPDSLHPDSINIVPTMRFNPVASIIHTMRIGINKREYMSHNAGTNYHADRYFQYAEGIDDRTQNFSIQNTLALELQEGFRPWVKMGMRFFAKHDYEHFVLLDGFADSSVYNENYITVGGQIMREKGKLFHFNVLGELRTTGKQWGEFNVEGWARFDIPVKRDSLSIKAYGFVRNEQPSFYYRHYHAQNAWWDNDLSNIFRFRVGGELKWWKTRLKVNFENITNYTHFASRLDMAPGYLTRYGVDVVQAPGSIQVLDATLCQDFSIGPLRWENELTIQQSTNQDHLPLPLFSAYTNLYLKFRIAKVLNTEIGADLRFFTKYYAPDYSPIIGQFASQSTESRTKIGGYPWVNVYINFLLKRARFFVMLSHVNYASGGNYFLVPHYPTNDRLLRFGISWNFVN